MTHATKNVIIETSEVDEGITELVKVLNKFPSVRTLYCCEGDEYDDDTLEGCYVAFDCPNSQRLAQLARLICKPQIGTIRIFWQSDSLDGRIMWSLRIDYLRNIRKITKALQGWIDNSNKEWPHRSN